MSKDDGEPGSRVSWDEVGWEAGRNLGVLGSKKAAAMQSWLAARVGFCPHMMTVEREVAN
jgi:hypothetical protein